MQWLGHWDHKFNSIVLSENLTLVFSWAINAPRRGGAPVQCVTLHHVQLSIMCRYLQEYVDAHGIGGLIQFRKKVTQVSRDGSPEAGGMWRVQVQEAKRPVPTPDGSGLTVCW